MTLTEEQTTVAPAVPGLWQRYGRMAARSRWTLGYVAALWVIALATGLNGPAESLLAKVGVGWPSLSAGYWWTPLTAGLFSSSFGSLLFKTALALVIMVPAERRLGPARMFSVLVAGQVLGSLLAVGLIKLGAWVGEPWLSSLTEELDVGPTTGIVAVGFAWSCTLTALWRRRLRLTLAVFILVTALYIGHIQEVVRACGALVGLVAGVLMFGRSAPLAWRSSHRETRVLVAILVAVSAFGALLANLVDQPNGPLSPFSFLFSVRSQSAAEIAQVCADLGPEGCAVERLSNRYASGLGILLGLMPVALLFVLAEGLRRGKRLAWWLTLAYWAALTVFEFWLLHDAYVDPTFSSNGSQAQWWVGAAEAMILPVLIVGVLLWTRRVFDLSSGRRAGLQLLATVVPALLVTGAVYLQFGLIFRDQFEPRPDIADLAADLPARLTAPAYLELFPVRFSPVGDMAEALFIYLFLAFWLVVLFALAAYFLKSRIASEEGAEVRSRRVLERGGSTLSYMSTWPGNAKWFSADGASAVAYRAINGVAVTLGDPYGKPTPETVPEFADFCAANGWTPCFYSVGAGVRAETEAMGWSSVQVAEDTVVPLAHLEFKGKKWQDIRTSLNKAKKEGVTAEWHSFPTAPLDLTAQIRALSEEWVADKGLPEMGFTLGGLDELDDPAVRCLIALDADRRVHGVTSWMPVYKDGVPTGWTLDFMRRRDDGFRGVMEFLIATAAQTFKEEGATFLSLSGAPLARLDRGDTPTSLQKFLDLMGKTMEPVYGFRSLFAFKAKFQPDYQPLYMTYPDPAALPSIGTALGRAYVPGLSAAQVVTLLHKLR